MHHRVISFKRSFWKIDEIRLILFFRISTHHSIISSFGPPLTLLTCKVWKVLSLNKLKCDKFNMQERVHRDSKMDFSQVVLYFLLFLGIFFSFTFSEFL